MLYRSVCAGCGARRYTPFFRIRPMFCNRECEAQYNIDEAAGEYLTTLRAIQDGSYDPDEAKPKDPP